MLTSADTYSICSIYLYCSIFNLYTCSHHCTYVFMLLSCVCDTCVHYTLFMLVRLVIIYLILYLNYIMSKCLILFPLHFFLFFIFEGSLERVCDCWPRDKFRTLKFQINFIFMSCTHSRLIQQLRHMGPIILCEPERVQVWSIDTF